MRFLSFGAEYFGYMLSGDEHVCGSTAFGIWSLWRKGGRAGEGRRYEMNNICRPLLSVWVLRLGSLILDIIY